MERLSASQYPERWLQEDELHNDAPNNFDFGASFAFDEASLPAQISTDTTLNSDCAVSQGAGCYSDPPYNFDGPEAYSSVVDALPPVTYATREFAVGGGINGLEDHFQVAFSDENTRQYPYNMSLSYPIMAPMVDAWDSMMKVGSAHHQLVDAAVGPLQLPRSMTAPTPMIASSLRSAYQYPIKDSIGSFSNPWYGQPLDVSSFSAYAFPNAQSYQPHPPLRLNLQNHARALPAVDDYASGSFTLPDASYLNSLHGWINDYNRLPGQYRNTYPTPWVSPTIGGPYSHVGRQPERAETIPMRSYPFQPQSIDEAMLPLNNTATDSVPLSFHIGTPILRTSSPETIGHEENRPEGGYLVDRDSQQSNPSGRKGARTTPPRTQSEPGRENSRRVRRTGGACEYCRWAKRACIPEVPCACCRDHADGQPKLWRALCYRRNFENALSGTPDIFEIRQREASIQVELASMHGDKQSLLLGNGLQLHSNFLSIEIDPSNVIHVEIQDTKPELTQLCISTDNNKTDTAGAMGMTKSYAIVHDSLPNLWKMDMWGRRDIESQAARWPDDLEVAYDLAFLRYSEIRPQLKCWDIVEDTMRIVSLGKFLDSRRPIDYDECMSLLESLIADPPRHFGIKEFNNCKTKFQLSMAARTQLYVRAARGIEETQKALGKKLDAAFRNRRGNVGNVLLVGACMRRLALEYRQRLERYRCFPPDLEQLQNRIHGCNYMYTLFTRVYDLWYRDRKNILPISPNWDVTGSNDIFGDNEGLVRLFSKLGRLEVDFCDKRLNSDDVLYISLIVDRGLGRPPKI